MRDLLAKLSTEVYRKLGQKKILLLISESSDQKELELELRRRIAFYFQNEVVPIKVVRCSGIGFLWYLLYPQLKLIYGINFRKRSMRFFLRLLWAFDIDFTRNPNDGWEWHYAIELYLSKKISLQELKRLSKRRLTLLMDSSKLLHKRCYVLGTGPSLAKAIEVDWSDGFRIVCNTIVKDKAMWHHVRPQVIVAGDAIYHFAFNDFARSFISDLKERLSESETVFVYPFHFHGFVSRELKGFEERLIPIPMVRRESVHVNLLNDFRLPTSVGNVLNMLLLPLACTVSRNVYLFGFDGRAPKDKLFWSNSSNHTYSEKLISIQESHPAFFKHYVPSDKEKSYVDSVHGEKLDSALIEAEQLGWNFVMMHSSHTATLNKRFKQ